MGKHDLNQLIVNCYAPQSHKNETEWNGMEQNRKTKQGNETDSDTSGRFWANGSGTFYDRNDYSMNFVVFFLS